MTEMTDSLFVSIRQSNDEEKNDNNKNAKSLISNKEMDDLISKFEITKFRDLQQLVVDKIGGAVRYPERKVMSDSLRASYCSAAVNKRIKDDKGNRGILLFSAHTG